ncbi:MAG: biotin carboxylase, partial [Parvibaculaceae bacterium]
MQTVRNVSDLRNVMHRNEQPIYFISATNFNLIGIDQWVRNLKFINYIDCFDGRHPNVFVPSKQAHDEFSSIEDINNHMLQHKDVIDHVKKRGGKPAATFLMFDEETEGLCDELGIDVWFPEAKLRS